MNKSGCLSLVLLFGTLLHCVAKVRSLESAPYVYSRNNYISDGEETDPEVMMAILTKLGQNIIRANDLENSKRGLDLGLSRGYSGAQQAKHLLGMAAAELPGGPGRRRRSQQGYRYVVPNFLMEQ